jgi:hypothetical protein
VEFEIRVGLVGLARKVISPAFLSPANTIFVPGMYLGGWGGLGGLLKLVVLIEWARLEG